MPFPDDVPTYDQVRDSLIAGLLANVRVVQGGVLVPPRLVVGSFVGTLPELMALVMDYFYGQLLVVHDGMRVPTAVGQDLLDLFALTGQSKIQGSYAYVAVKLTRNSPANAPAIVIPVNAVVLALDSSGNATLPFLFQQNPSLPPGQSAVLPYGASSVWAIAKAQFSGSIYNIGPNTIAQMQTDMPGIDSVANPPILQAGGVAVTTVGAAGATTYQYEVVAKGVLGYATPSPIGQTSTGNAALSPSNYNVVTWNLVQDDNGYDILRLVNGTPMLVGSVGQGVTTFNDQGATPLPYSVPVSNTSNQGQGGTDDESDDAFRTRAPNAVSNSNTSSNGNIVNALQQLSGVARAFVSDGAPGAITVSIIGTASPIPDDVQTAITSTIDTYKGAGIVPTWSAISPVNVAVAYTFAAQPGVSASSLIPAIDAALIAYFNTLAVDQGVRWSDVVGVIKSVAGVAAVNTISMTPSGGGTYTLADLPAQANVVYGIPASGTGLTASVGS